jgi:hypothetical protein
MSESTRVKGGSGGYLLEDGRLLLAASICMLIRVVLK